MGDKTKYLLARVAERGVMVAEVLERVHPAPEVLWHLVVHGSI
jgi:hypothetical protein